MTIGGNPFWRAAAGYSTGWRCRRGRRGRPAGRGRRGRAAPRYTEGMPASSPTTPNPPAYHEVQRFRQWWLWMLVSGPAVLAWLPFIQQILRGEPVGQNPAPDWVVWLLWLLIGLGLPFLFGRLRLVLEVTDADVLIRYRPFSRRTIPLVRHRPRGGPQLQRRQGVRGLGHQGLVQRQDGVQRERRSGRGVDVARRQAGDARVSASGRAGRSHRGAAKQGRYSSTGRGWIFGRPLAHCLTSLSLRPYAGLTADRVLSCLR